jgi:hypothetical protein
MVNCFIPNCNMFAFLTYIVTRTSLVVCIFFDLREVKPILTCPELLAAVHARVTRSYSSKVPCIWGSSGMYGGICSVAGGHVALSNLKKVDPVNNSQILINNSLVVDDEIQSRWFQGFRKLLTSLIL